MQFISKLNLNNCVSSRCPAPELNLRLKHRWQTLEYQPGSGFLLKLFKINKNVLNNKNLSRGWTLVLELVTPVPDLVVGSVNGYNAAVTQSGKIISVTSFGNRAINSMSPQFKIGSNRFYGIMLRFLGAPDELEIEKAGLYLNEFVSVECLEDENLTLIDSECQAYDEQFDVPNELSLEAQRTCPVGEINNVEDSGLDITYLIDLSSQTVSDQTDMEYVERFVFDTNNAIGDSGVEDFFLTFQYSAF